MTSRDSPRTHVQPLAHSLCRVHSASRSARRARRAWAVQFGEGRHRGSVILAEELHHAGRRIGIVESVIAARHAERGHAALESLAHDGFLTPQERRGHCGRRHVAGDGFEHLPGEARVGPVAHRDRRRRVCRRGAISAAASSGRGANMAAEDAGHEIELGVREGQRFGVAFAELHVQAFFGGARAGAVDPVRSDIYSRRARRRRGPQSGQVGRIRSPHRAGSRPVGCRAAHKIPRFPFSGIARTGRNRLPSMRISGGS